MKKITKYFLIAVFWTGIWYLAVLLYSLFNNMDLSYNPLFPYPHDVVKSLIGLLSLKEFYFSTAATLLRIIFSMILSIIIAIFCAILCAKIKLFHSFIQPLLSTIKSVPVTVFVFILYLLVFELTSSIITILMVFPIIFSNVYEGIKNTDKDLLEVCKVYKIPFKKRIHSLYLPTVMPYFSSALTASIGLAWKAGVAAEALCPPKTSIGWYISLSKQNFDNEELFAWALTLIIVNLIFEFVFIKAINSLFKKWLPKEKV